MYNKINITMGKINTKFRVMVMKNSLRAGYAARGLQRVGDVLLLKLSSGYKMFLYLFVYLRWFILTKKITQIRGFVTFTD